MDVSGGGWGGFLLGKLTRQGAKLVKGIGAARNDSGLPEDELSTDEWVCKYTKNEGVRGIFRNMCGSVFAVSSEELPARVFLTYFTRKSAFKTFGFAPEGTIGIWRSLASAFERDGGQLWLNAEVESIITADGQVTGAVIERDGQSVEVSCRFAVSDTGPAATVSLVGSENLPADYLETVKRGDRPCSMIAVNFASQDRLIDVPGMLSFANTKRLCYVANFTDVCPEMAPEGWNLYVGAAVPKPAVGDFDEEAETKILLDELQAEIKGFDKARILSVVTTRDGCRRSARCRASICQTPLRSPTCGTSATGVKEYANGGTTACAETARLLSTRSGSDSLWKRLRSGSEDLRAAATGRFSGHRFSPLPRPSWRLPSWCRTCDRLPSQCWTSRPRA